jgi:hypothetical protein
MAVHPVRDVVEGRTTASGQVQPSESSPQAPTRPSPLRRRPLVLAIAAVSVLTVGVGGAVTGSQIVHRNANGVTVVEGQQLHVIYHGTLINQDEYAGLTDKGKGLFTATDVDTARELGAMRAFDTQALLDAYDKAYMAWQTGKRLGRVVPPWTDLAPLTWSPGS